MEITLGSIGRDGVVRLVAKGNMRAADFAANGDHPLAKVLGEQWPSHRVALDLGGTDYMDSSAIGWLLSCQKQFKAHDGSLVLYAVQPSVQQLFDMLKIDRVLKLADTESDAVQILQGE